MRCGIALGSNLGDRIAHLRAARTALASLHQGSGAPLLSPVYETEPVDCEPGTAPYLNAVMEIESDLDPAALLHRLQQIERSMGRPSEHLRNAPRTLDLDLLYAGEMTLQSAELTLPHPRIATRRFVLQPLADLHPDLILPGTDRPVASFLSALPLNPSVQLWAQPI
jgi:2-amino-4-hydroxy-6-hydroxymethyldihydropteridine diphosphokinase